MICGYWSEACFKPAQKLNEFLSCKNVFSTLFIRTLGWNFKTDCWKPGLDWGSSQRAAWNCAMSLGCNKKQNSYRAHFNGAQIGDPPLFSFHLFDLFSLHSGASFRRHSFRVKWTGILCMKNCWRESGAHSTGIWRYVDESEVLLR